MHCTESAAQRGVVSRSVSNLTVWISPIEYSRSDERESAWSWALQANLPAAWPSEALLVVVADALKVDQDAAEGRPDVLHTDTCAYRACMSAGRQRTVAVRCTVEDRKKFIGQSTVPPFDVG